MMPAYDSEGEAVWSVQCVFRKLDFLFKKDDKTSTPENPSNIG